MRFESVLRLKLDQDDDEEKPGAPKKPPTDLAPKDDDDPAGDDPDVTPDKKALKDALIQRKLLELKRQQIESFKADKLNDAQELLKDRVKLKLQDFANQDKQAKTRVDELSPELAKAKAAVEQARAQLADAEKRLAALSKASSALRKGSSSSSSERKGIDKRSPDRQAMR